MSASWSWKSSGDTAVVRKTDDGLEPGAAVVAINNNTNALQYITGAGSLTVDSLSTPGTTKLALASNVVEFVSNSANVLSQTIVSNTLLTSYSGLALPIANGGTANTSIPTTVTASRYSAWDANGNDFARGYVTTVTGISSNTTFTTSNITSLIYCTNAAVAPFTIALPDVAVGNTVSAGYQTDIINVSLYTVSITTSNSATTFTANGSGTSMTVTAIPTGQILVGDVITGAPGGATTVTSVPAGGHTGVYGVSPAVGTYTGSTLTTTHTNAPYLLTTAQPNTTTRCTFINTTEIPYWNFINLSGYNGGSNTYSFIVGSTGISRALYLNTSAVTSTTATTTLATNILVEAGSGPYGNIFLPDPSTVIVGTTYTIYGISCDWLIYSYTARAVWETYAPATPGLGPPYFIPQPYNAAEYHYTSSYSNSQVNITCVSNSSAPGYGAWQFTKVSPVISDVQASTAQTLQILLGLTEIICSFASGPLLAQAAQPLHAIDCILPTYAQLYPHAIGVVRIDMPSSIRSGVIANIVAGTMRTQNVNYLKQYTSTIVKNLQTIPVYVYASTGAVIGSLFPQSQVSLTYTNAPANVLAYAVGTTMTVTQLNGGGLILGSVAFPSSMYVFGDATTLTCTGGISGTGGLGTYTISPGHTFGSVGTPIQVWIDPHVLQQYTIQSIAVLDSVAGNIVTNNYAPAIQTIVSSGSTIVLDETAPHVTALTGSTNQVVILPKSTGIPIGWSATFTGPTVGTTTINGNDGSNASSGIVVTIPPSGKATCYLIAQNDVLADWSTTAIGQGNMVIANNLATDILSTNAFTITLTATSPNKILVGPNISANTVVLPDVATLPIGAEYQINSIASFNLTINSSNGSLVAGSIPYGSNILCVSSSITDNTAGWLAYFDGTQVGYGTAYRYGGTFNTSVPANPLQVLRSTNTTNNGIYTSAWDYAYTPSTTGTWTPVVTCTAGTCTISSQLCNYYVNTFFTGTAGATVTQVHCQVGIILSGTNYSGSTPPFRITLPFTAGSQTTDFPIIVTNTGGSAALFGQIASSGTYLNVTSKSNWTFANGDTWAATFFYQV